jgi:hypothetical protein
MINAAREGLRKWTKVAELDASTFLAREPYHLSLSLADVILRIQSKPKKGGTILSGPSKPVLSSPAADAINAANKGAVVPYALGCEALYYCDPAGPTLAR